MSGAGKLKTAYEKLEDEIKNLDILLKAQLTTHSKESQATAEKLIQKTAEKKAIDDQRNALVVLNNVQDEGNNLLKIYNEQLRLEIATNPKLAAETSAKIQQIKNYQAALDDLIKKLQEKTA